LAGELKFIADINVGKLARWLRMMGYDTVIFDGDDDQQMVLAALNEDRVILTRDTQVMKRGVIANGRLRAVLLTSDDAEQQIRQVMEALDLEEPFRPFTLCLECNQPLEERSKRQVKDLVPPYVYKTQNQYMQCPKCQRVYWKGTHWEAMTRRLEKIKQG
jgi:uncharacterized protein with PIN domain